MAITKKVYIVGAFIAVALAIAARYYSVFLPQPKVEEPTYSLKLNDTINKRLSSKANYDFGDEATTVPEECQVIHTETIQRHGARHVNKIEKLENIEKFFKSLDESHQFKNSKLMDWINDLISKERGHEDEICDTGKAELQGIAHRMRDRLHMDKDMSGDIIIENTYKKRTIQSRDIFLSSFLPSSFPQSHIHYKQAYHCEDVFNPDGSVNPSRFYDFASLRYYTMCPNYNKAISQEYLLKAVNSSFYNTHEFAILRTYNNMWKKFLRRNNTLNDHERRDLVKNLYVMCQYEASCYNEYSRSCDILMREMGVFDQLEYDENMRLYAFKGEGNPLYYRMAIPLTQSILRGLAFSYMNEMTNQTQKEEFFEKYDPYFNLTSVEPSRVHMRFAHAESILPLYFLFIMKPARVQTNRMGFSGVDFIPMSANMQWNLLKCEGKYYIQQITNDMRTPLSLPVYKETFIFDIDAYFDQWLSILDEQELENNQLEDFMDLCDGVKCMKKDCYVCYNKKITYHKSLLSSNLQSDNLQVKQLKYNQDLMTSGHQSDWSRS